jgi:hypothetical protein
MTDTPGGASDDEKDGGAGPEGTIPDTQNGIGATTLDEPSNFEPEEDDVDTGGGSSS